MPLPNATFIAELDPNRPQGAEDLREGDDWLRLITGVLQNTFPTADKALPIASWAAKDASSTTKTTSYTPVAADDGRTIAVDATGGPVDITLPDPAAFDAFRCTVVKVDSSANAVTLVGTASGQTDYQLTGQWGIVELYSTGAAWLILSGPPGVSGTPGTVLAYDANGQLQAIGPGSAGQVLQSQGALLPPKWGSGVPTGAYMPYISLNAPEGWVFSRGTTIGNAASGATERANADCQDLFLLLWESPNTTAPVVGGRGASAIEDWNANKRITLRDLRGRGLFGMDDMGAPLTTRLRNGWNGQNSNTQGGVVGRDSFSLVTANLPPSYPPGSDGLSTGDTGSGGGPAGLRPNNTTNLGGTSVAIDNVPPGIVDAIIVKL